MYIKDEKNILLLYILNKPIIMVIIIFSTDTNIVFISVTICGKNIRRTFVFQSPIISCFNHKLTIVFGCNVADKDILCELHLESRRQKRGKASQTRCWQQASAGLRKYKGRADTNTNAHIYHHEVLCLKHCESYQLYSSLE